MLKTLRVVSVGTSGRFAIHEFEGFAVRGSNLTEEEMKKRVEEITTRNNRLNIKTSVVYD